jgi:hypothetical protein
MLVAQRHDATINPHPVHDREMSFIGTVDTLALSSARLYRAGAHAATNAAALAAKARNVDRSAGASSQPATTRALTP